jgi:hypothetical protein
VNGSCQRWKEALVADILSIEILIEVEEGARGHRSGRGLHEVGNKKGGRSSTSKLWIGEWPFKGMPGKKWLIAMWI